MTIDEKAFWLLSHEYKEKFYPNGKIMVKGWSKNGLKDGKFIWFNSDGSIKLINYYKDGKEIKSP